MQPLPPVLGFAAFSGTGKTTLLTKLIPLLHERGLRLGLIKRSHHAFEVDRPGKDSYLLRQAGAAQLLVASAQRTLLIIKQRHEPALEDLLQRVNSRGLDLILVEGFKHHPIAKLELHRPSLGYPLLCSTDPAIIAVAADAPLQEAIPLPVLNLNDPPGIADFIQDWFLKISSAGPAPGVQADRPG